jgi:hypothetical protein
VAVTLSGVIADLARRVRRYATVLAVCGGCLALADPAAAVPSDWWYGELSIAQAQRVSEGAGVIVGVVDSGVQATLPDLAGRVLPGSSVHGGDARTDIPNSTVHYFGHGTGVAGFIVGTGRGAGMLGVAPQAKVIPYGDSDAGAEATASGTEAGIRWVVAHGARIVNVSSAGAAPCPDAMQAAVDDAVRHDAIVVAGTGNSPGSAIGYPANCVGAIAVGGLADSAGFRAWSGESAGPQLDFVAPAQKLRQLLLDNTLSAADSQGTSLSTAIVSGTFALLRSKFPHDTARQIVTRALYNVHNGFGGKVFAKRISDQLGYGEILPRFALTEAPPRNAVNPIYDAIDRHLQAEAGPSSSPSSDQSSSATGGATSAASSAPAATSTPHASGGGGSSTGVVVGVIAAIVVVLAVGLGIAFSRRSRRNAT